MGSTKTSQTKPWIMKNKLWSRSSLLDLYMERGRRLHCLMLMLYIFPTLTERERERERDLRATSWRCCAIGEQRATSSDLRGARSEQQEQAGSKEGIQSNIKRFHFYFFFSQNFINIRLKKYELAKFRLVWKLSRNQFWLSPTLAGKSPNLTGTLTLFLGLCPTLITTPWTHLVIKVLNSIPLLWPLKFKWGVKWLHALNQMSKHLKIKNSKKNNIWTLNLTNLTNMSNNNPIYFSFIKLLLYQSSCLELVGLLVRKVVRQRGSLWTMMLAFYPHSTVEIEHAINDATWTVPLHDSLTFYLKVLVVVSHEHTYIHTYTYIHIIHTYTHITYIHTDMSIMTEIIKRVGGGITAIDGACRSVNGTCDLHPQIWIRNNVQKRKLSEVAQLWFLSRPTLSKVSQPTYFGRPTYLLSSSKLDIVVAQPN